MSRLYGVRCDRPDCKRIVAFAEAFCCHRCERDEINHSDGCDSRQEAWKAQRKDTQ